MFKKNASNQSRGTIAASFAGLLFAIWGMVGITSAAVAPTSGARSSGAVAPTSGARSSGAVAPTSGARSSGAVAPVTSQARGGVVTGMKALGQALQK